MKSKVIDPPARKELFEKMLSFNGVDCYDYTDSGGIGSFRIMQYFMGRKISAVTQLEPHRARNMTF